MALPTDPRLTDPNQIGWPFGAPRDRGMGGGAWAPPPIIGVTPGTMGGPPPTPPGAPQVASLGTAVPGGATPPVEPAPGVTPPPAPSAPPVIPNPGTVQAGAGPSAAPVIGGTPRPVDPDRFKPIGGQPAPPAPAAAPLAAGGPVSSGAPNPIAAPPPAAAAPPPAAAGGGLGAAFKDPKFGAGLAQIAKGLGGGGGGGGAPDMQMAPISGFDPGAASRASAPKLLEQILAARKQRGGGGGPPPGLMGG